MSVARKKQSKGDPVDWKILMVKGLLLFLIMQIANDKDPTLVACFKKMAFKKSKILSELIFKLA